ncbi:MAG: ParB/RepB/Spo0J family partition protein [Halothiobacillaceae bacterium]|nr:ParB/RepB/Spo0J family partition protein [Halothiobacillaceae bacterium]
MSAAKRGLGRGLGSLLSSAEAPREGEILQLAISRIRPNPWQPRQVFDADMLEQLALSIRSQGLLQPVVVRPQGDDYELIAGERRWRACGLAELTHISAVVRHVDDRTTAALALVENLQREDLNALEKALGIKRLIDDFGLTHQQAGEILGHSRAHVSNLLRLLELAPAVQGLVESGQLDMGHARALLPLDKILQEELAEKIAARPMSVREVESLVNRLLNSKDDAPADAPAPDANISALERRLSENLGAPAEIRHGQRGKGQIILRYGSLNELDALLSRLHLDTEIQNT